MNNILPEIIFEVANSHDGSLQNLKKIITQIKSLKYLNKSIKFQIFSPDGISTQNYKWYKTYKKICFSKKNWKSILENVKSEKIYLDIFDLFGIEMLAENIDVISGIKLQSSIIDNLQVNNALKKLNLKKKKLILNISGYKIGDIKQKLKFYNNQFKEVIIQVGFQNYPTNIEDLGYTKLNILKKTFPQYKISLADHISYKDDMCTILPAFSMFWGIDVIEKHFCLVHEKTKFDYYSSLNKKQAIKLVNYIIHLKKLNVNKNFISKNEKRYLDETKQLIVTKKNIERGNFISQGDLVHKRTSVKGLNFSQIQTLQRNQKILNVNLKKNDAVLREYFKKAKIGILIACRLKSKRLPNKALLKIGSKKLIEHCINFCLKSKLSNQVILTTSNLKEDDDLVNLKIKNINFFRGDPNDVIQRYINCSRKFKIDVIVRVTGDCPFVSPKIIDYLIKSHFNIGADFTYADKFSIGTSVEIINLNSLKYILKNRKFDISEYMSFYFKNNPDIFNLNRVKLPRFLVRNHRLTVDYKQDIEMLSKLLKVLKKKKKRLSIENIFQELDSNKYLRSINSKSEIVYIDNKEFVKTLNLKSKLIHN